MRPRHRACAFVFAAGLMSAGPIAAETIELRIHHFLPPSSVAQTELIEPWAEALERESDGRITARIFPAMQLGGAPPQLVDQVRDGVADVVWTLPGYTPGRFPMMAVFELPFMVSDAEATSQAVHAFYEAHARAEFADIHPILVHAHGPGVIHTRGKGIESVADMEGLQLRAPGRAIGDALEAYGATPIFMPVPQVPEALARNVIDGAVVPWEVTVPLRLYEIADHHTEIPGERGLYTAVFLFAMNKQRYESLPGDLRAIVDANSGQHLAARVGQAWDEADGPGRRMAEERGNRIVTLPEDEVAVLRERAEGVHEAWMAEMDAAGHDGRALFEAAQSLIDHYTAETN